MVRFLPGVKGSGFVTHSFPEEGCSSEPVAVDLSFNVDLTLFWDPTSRIK